MTLGEHIAQLRAARGLSQEDLADALGVSRQSVSKWETDASVPELEKLVRLSDCFGVTLDQLVRGEAPAPAEPVPPAEPGGAERPAPSAARRALGGALVAVGLLGALLLLLLAGLEGLLLWAFFVFPLLLCGIVCLAARRRAGLWCAWAVYLPQQLYWSAATGLSWRVVLLTPVWTPEMNYMRLIIGWAMLVVMLALLAGSLWSFRRARLAPSGWRWALGGAAAALGILLLALRPGTIPQVQLLSVWLGQGLVDGAGLASLTVGACLLLALRRGRSAALPQD